MSYAVKKDNTSWRAVASEADIHEDEDFSAALPEPPAMSWDTVRAKRDSLLSQCDWTQLDDSPLSSLAKSDWATYREDLRNLPQVYDTPDDVVWPTIPT